MISTIKSIKSLEIIDSRGNPTVRTFVTLESGVTASASVPSGASTGSHEAVELRDGDPRRYDGKGVEKAVEHVNTVLAKELHLKDVMKPDAIDELLLMLDGTENKSALGANALLSVSLAVMKAGALAQGKPLWQWINEYYFTETQPIFPRIMVNIVNGGKHAAWAFDIQEFMIVPTTAVPSHSVRKAVEIFQTLGKNLHEKKLSTLLGDEGGYAPALSSNEEVLEAIIRAAKEVSYEPTVDFDIALDSAASEWFSNGSYVLPSKEKTISTKELEDYYLSLREKYHILSFEDPFSEDDWDAFTSMTKHAKDFLTVGDDLYVTNPKRLEKGVDMHASNAILVKVNQIGTLVETVRTIEMARKANMEIVISHRSGETEDSFIADLAFACASDFIKTGSMARSERLAKYNRLLEIEHGL